jgi:hypothetical protein
MSKGLSLEEQSELVSSCRSGYKLNATVSLKYGQKCVITCSEGHTITTAWRDLKNKLSKETFCNDCYMLDKVRAKASEKGFKFEATEWKGYDAQYDFTCPEGHTRSYLWKYFNKQEGNLELV